MTLIRKYLVGAVTGAALLASAGIVQAQDAADAETPAADMGAQSNMQYCVPGCVVGPMAGDDMHHGMMGQGMMGQGAMPMMMAPGMMNQGMMPMMGYGMMGQGSMPMMMAPGMMNQGMMPMMGYGMTGQGMMMPMMMAPGMMGQGMMNQGAMGQGMMNQGATPMMGMAAAAPLDADHVRPHLEQHLAMMGLPNLMLGSIEAEDDDTLVAEIVTRDGTLVQRLAVDRHSGAVTPLE